MVKAVIFDCFGVLATETWLSFKDEHFGHDPELFKQASDINYQANRGLISREEAVRATAELAGISPAEFHRAISRNVPNEELFEYIKEIKPDHKLGLLSNIAADFLHQIFTAEQLALFDSVVLSYENGFIKPQPEAFAIAAKQLGVDVAECVLIDDQQRNVDGARRAGMSALSYRDVPELRRELGALLKA